jgi:hypothetical protein
MYCENCGNMFSVARSYSNVNFLLIIGILILIINISAFVYYRIKSEDIFEK